MRGGPPFALSYESTMRPGGACALLRPLICPEAGQSGLETLYEGSQEGPSGTEPGRRKTDILHARFQTWCWNLLHRRLFTQDGAAKNDNAKEEESTEWAITLRTATRQFQQPQIPPVLRLHHLRQQSDCLHQSLRPPPPLPTQPPLPHPS